MHEEFTREFCGDSIVQHKPFIQVEFRWECCYDSIVQHEAFSWSLREIAVMIP